MQVPKMKPEKLEENIYTHTGIFKWILILLIGVVFGRSHSDFFLQTHAVAILFTTELPCIAVPSVNIEVIVFIDKNKRYEEDPPGPSPTVL